VPWAGSSTLTAQPKDTYRPLGGCSFVTRSGIAANPAKPHGRLNLGTYTYGFMNPNSIVIVSLHSPKEKIWGILLDINPSGVTLRGIDLNSFDLFVSQINQLDGERVGLPTVFFPMMRVERVSLDEPSGSIPSMEEIFQRKIGRSLFDYLAQFA